MKYKFFLPIILLSTLFVFQQVKADNKSLPNINTVPQPHLQQGFTAPETIWAYIYHLNPDGSRAQGDILCGSGDNNYGCVADGSGQLYPYDFNPQEVSLENDYLLDVITREMLPKKYHEKAVHAQALAARSFVYYTVNEFGFVENSTNDQVFVPYTFEHWLDGYPNNTNNPCASADLTVYQQTVCDATSSRFYIAPNGSNQPANTEFSSDIYSATEAGSEPYLISVQDPISTICDTLTGIFGNDRGMSQEGASRWARGNQCAIDESGNMPWPVTWIDHNQILAHYYTGIDILDGNGSKVAPDDRWNLLSYDSLNTAG